MVKIVEFQERATERLEDFRSNAKALPALMYARYVTPPSSSVCKKVQSVVFAMRKRQKHVMHLQHRENCASVLGYLIKRMDVRNRRVLYVNPRFNIRRNIYVPEIARELNLCDRTVSRVLGSLERAGYLFRTATTKGSTMFLSLTLFRDLQCSLMFERLSNQINGLAKAMAKGIVGKKSKANAGAATPSKAPAISQCENSTPAPYAPREPVSEASKAIAASHLASLRRRRPPPG